MRKPAPTANLRDAVIRVGDGRGFIVAGDFDRYILTAAHCLPAFPVPGACESGGAPYPDLLGRIDDGKSGVSANCLFVDPIGDVAILGAPDDQVFPDEFEAYSELTGQTPTVSVAEKLPFPPTGEPRSGNGWILNLEGRWFGCDIEINGSPIGCAINLQNAEESILPGMSGSPILGEDTKAISLLSIACESSGATESGPNPCLAHNLPGWFFRVSASKKRR